MPNYLVTGASGFFGSLLKRRLIAEGHQVHNIDLVPDNDHNPGHPNLGFTQGDIRDEKLLHSIFVHGKFDAVFHCAAMLAHEKISDADLWSSNVDGTRNIAQACVDHAVPHLVFTSTNCLWAHDLGHEVHERDIPAPIELYGKSKLAAEQVLAEFSQLTTVIIRCPTIIDAGRLGLLAILFEFIEDGKRVWVVGDGGNRYQFVYAQDLATACMLSLSLEASDLFHVGSDDVPTLRQVYQSVIDQSGNTKARVAQLPKGPTLAAMQLAHKLGISPLGPYHYRMIAKNFVFDTSHIKQTLGWRPTLTNQQMMLEAFRYYQQQRAEIHARTDVSAHSKAADMGIIRLLKWLS